MINKVVIVISGGVLTDVYAKEPLEVQLVDFDDMEAKGLASDEREAELTKAIQDMECVY